MLDDPEVAARVQPAPTGNGIDIAGEAAADLKAMGHIDISEDIEARIRLGEKKYGTRLKSHNGRDAYLDLYQEILDGINYSKQLVIEGLEDDTFFMCLVDLAVVVRTKLHNRS
jgi:hypothetical protein